VSWAARFMQEVEASPCEGKLKLPFGSENSMRDPFASQGDKREEEYP